MDRGTESRLFNFIDHTTLLCSVLILCILLCTSCDADTSTESDQLPITSLEPAILQVSPDTIRFSALNGLQTVTANVLTKDSLVLEDIEVLWHSSDDSIISLSIRDNFSARLSSHANGTAVVTVSTGSLSRSIPCLVSQEAAAVITSPAEPALEFPGDTLTIAATFVDALGNPLPPATTTWKFEQGSSVSVSPDGLITAEALGTSTITAIRDDRLFEVAVDVLGDRFFLNGETRLRYALDTPVGDTDAPWLVFVHGSGPITRQQLAPFTLPFVNAGVGMLRYDKRGTGESSGTFLNVGPANGDRNVTTLATDVVQAVQLLKRHPEINPSSIGLIANSQGGWIAPVAAQLSADIDFVLLWSGTTVSVGLEIYYSNLADGTSTPLDEVYNQLSSFNGLEGFDPMPVWRSIDQPALWLLGGMDRSIPTRLDSANVRLLQSQGKPQAFIFYSNAAHDLRDVQSNRFVDLWSDYLDWMQSNGFLRP